MSSQIDPPGRHILLTLLSRTTASTAEIPSKHTPSFTELEALTGYSRSTLIEWMKALGESHWFTRPVLDGDTKPGMRLDVGDLSAARPKRSRTSKTGDAAYRQAVRAEPATVPPGDMDRTAQRYSAVPPGGTDEGAHLLKDFPTESLTLTDPNPARAADAAAADGGFALDFGPRVAAEPEQEKPKTKSEPKEESAGQRNNRIAKLYTDKVKLVAFHGVRSVVDAAFKTGDYSEEQITAAVTNMADARLPISQTSLRIAIEGLPKWANPPYQGRRDSNSNGGKSGYIRMTDSHSPDRDYSENY